MRTKPIHKVNAGKPSAHRFFAGPSGLHPDLFAVELEGSDAVTGYLDDDQARELRNELTDFLGDVNDHAESEQPAPAENVVNDAPIFGAQQYSITTGKSLEALENATTMWQKMGLTDDRIQVNPPDDRPSPFVDYDPERERLVRMLKANQQEQVMREAHQLQQERRANAIIDTLYLQGTPISDAIRIAARLLDEDR